MKLNEIYGPLYDNVKEIRLRYNGLEYYVCDNGFSVDFSIATTLCLFSPIYIALDHCTSKDAETMTEEELRSLPAIYDTNYYRLGLHLKLYILDNGESFYNDGMVIIDIDKYGEKFEKV